MGEALYRKYKATGDKKYYVAPKDGFLSIDALGFRRGAGALKTLLQDQGLADDPLFAQAKEGGRGIHALSGHIESIDQSNDVNGGPSGVGLATAAGQGRVLGHGRRAGRRAEGDRVRGRVRAVRRSRAGSEDSGARPESGQAAPGHVLGEQRRHRRFAARRRDRQQVHRLRLRRPVEIVRLERDDDGQRPRLRSDRQPPEDDGGVGPDRSAPDDRHRQDHQRLLADRVERQDRRLVRPGRRLSEPSVRHEDELGLFRHAGEDLRGQVRRRVPGHSQRRRHRYEGAAGPVQDQHGRGAVGARQERSGRLAGQSHRGNRRSGQRTTSSSASTSRAIRSSTTA